MRTGKIGDHFLQIAAELKPQTNAAAAIVDNVDVDEDEDASKLRCPSFECIIPLIRMKLPFLTNT